MAYNREEKNTCYAPSQTNKNEKKMRCHVTSKQKANSQSVEVFWHLFHHELIPTCPTGRHPKCKLALRLAHGRLISGLCFLN